MKRLTLWLAACAAICTPALAHEERAEAPAAAAAPGRQG